MPSGGGSAGGGGGFSGGGFSGGGFSGGWSSHSYGYGRSRGYSFSGGGGGGKGSLLWTVVVLIITLLVIGGVVGIAIGVGRNNRSSTDISTDHWAPGETRILSLSSFFCEGGNLELNSNSRSVDAELYILNTVPPLNVTNNFTITLQSTLDGLEFRFWQYHLHPDSKLELTVETDLSIDVYIVKGNENANSWARNPQPSVAEEFFTARGESFPRITYRIEEEDEYYIIVHNSFRSAPVLVDALFTIMRFEFSPPLDADSCTVMEEGLCSVGVPYRSTGSQTFLVVTTTPQNADYSENIEVQLLCGQRGWAYAVVILVPMIVTALVVASIAIAAVWYFKYKD